MAALGRSFQVEVANIVVHCEEIGRGYPIVFIHGSAPGATSRNTWARVAPHLAIKFRVVATDLVGWGVSGRKVDEPYFDPDIWAAQVRAIIDRVAPTGPVGVLGHSLGGFVALLAAARDSRIDHVLANGAMGVPFDSNEVIEAGWTFPENIEAQRAVYDQILTIQSRAEREAIVNDRLAVMSAPGYKEYYSRMFAGPAQRLINRAVLTEEEFANIKAKVLLTFGKDDVAVPFLTAGIALGRAIPHAHLLRIAGSGHATMIDAPDRFLTAALSFFPR